MRELNLRSDFELFNWNKTTKRQKAYQAVTNRELTSHFDRSVWKEIVDHLKDLQSEMGLEWDSTYGSGINEWWIFTFADFTAKMFNAVTLNLKKDINTTLRWEWDEEYEGYLGRTFVKGCGLLRSQEGDTVYGSYILEIVNSLNKYIKICKGDADFRNLNSIVSAFNTSFDVTISSPVCAALEILQEEISSHSANLTNRSKRLLSSALVNSTYANARASLKYASNLFRARTISRTLCQAEISLELLYRNLRSLVISLATPNVNLKISNKKAVLSVDELSSFEDMVRLSFADTIDCIANIINETNEQAEINTQLPSKLEVNKVFDECFTALLELGEGFALSGNALSRSFASGTMFLQEKSEVASVVGSVLRIMRTSMDRLAIKGMRSSQSSRANISRKTMVSLPALVGEFEELNSLLRIYPPSLRVFLSTYLECTVGSSMWQSSEMWQGIAEHIDSAISSKQEHQAGLISRGIKGFDGIIDCVCGVSCQAIAMMLKDCVVSIVNRANYSVELERYRDSSNLSIDVELCMENISHLSTLRYDEYPQINTQFTSLENAIVEILEPFGVQINETFHTAISSLLVLRTANDTCLTDIRALSEEISAELANICLTYFENQTTSEMEINASMEFDPASWNNPEFRDDGLHIWQIYETTRTGDTLYLDKEDA